MRLLSSFLAIVAVDTAENSCPPKFGRSGPPWREGPFSGRRAQDACSGAERSAETKAAERCRAEIASLAADFHKFQTENAKIQQSTKV